MRKISENKKYDTETAKMLGSRIDHEFGDLGLCKETLYVKKNGEYFLYAEGESSPICMSTDLELLLKGNDIFPLSDDEAREWAMNYLDCGTFEGIFGEVAE